MTATTETFDVAVVGAGVVGAATARDLACAGLRVAVLDAANDVGTGTSKANTALLHTGFDAPPGSVEARLVRRGYERLRRHAEGAGIPMEIIGALVIAWTTEQEERLDYVHDTARANGYERGQRLTAAELRALEPGLAAGATGALRIPDEGIICPFTPVISFTTEAVNHAALLLLGFSVAALLRDSATWTVTAQDGRQVRARWVVNCAGLASATIDRLAGHDRFRVLPRKGELLVLDKSARGLLRHILLQVPTEHTKGIVVAPTVFGNVLVGPTADDIDDPTDTSTTAEGIEHVLAAGQRVLPGLAGHEVTAAYAGLRAATDDRDYVLRLDEQRTYVCAGGIRSTGLSSSLGIAEEITTWICGGAATEAAVNTPPLTMPAIGETQCRPYQDADLIRGDAAYGEIVCFCERVTAGEIRDALNGAVPARDVDGLRRRTRAQLGRCQGFFCSAQVAEMLKRNANVPDGARGTT